MSVWEGGEPSSSRRVCFSPPPPGQGLQSMVSQQRSEVESQLRCAEHQAERLRIEIVSLREKLDQEIAARSGLQGELEKEREEKGRWGREA